MSESSELQHPPIGILMLDTRFKRLHGDIGHSGTWPFPVSYKIVAGASPKQVVLQQDPVWLQAFIDAADELIAEGVIGITTTCGFLGLYQQELANHCSVPVATSALLQVPIVERLIGATQRVGVLTYNARSLSHAHLQSVGVATDTPIIGIPEHSAFYRWIMHGDNAISIEEIRDDAICAATTLVRDFPEVGAIVSECTNLTPFANEIQKAVNRPVYDMVSMLHWFKLGLAPMQFCED